MKRRRGIEKRESELVKQECGLKYTGPHVYLVAALTICLLKVQTVSAVCNVNTLSDLMNAAK